MNLEEGRALLARYSYKPGWTFELHVNYVRPFYYLRIKFDTLDSRGSGKTLPVVVPCEIPADFMHAANEDMFHSVVRMAIDAAEYHETSEWFRMDGELIDDPHKRARENES